MTLLFTFTFTFSDVNYENKLNIAFVLSDVRAHFSELVLDRAARCGEHITCDWNVQWTVSSRTVSYKAVSLDNE
jgi:hypothetical protein